MPGDEPVFSLRCINNCLIVYCSVGIVCHDQCQCTLGNSIHKRQALKPLWQHTIQHLGELLEGRASGWLVLDV